MTSCSKIRLHFLYRPNKAHLKNSINACHQVCALFQRLILPIADGRWAIVGGGIEEIEEEVRERVRRYSQCARSCEDAYALCMKEAQADTTGNAQASCDILRWLCLKGCGLSS